MPAESLVEGEIYRDEHWPHGLMCSQCRHVLREPERFTSQLDAFVEDTPLTRIVCLPCALPERG
jgi:hypothetical protein